MKTLARWLGRLGVAGTVIFAGVLVRGSESSSSKCNPDGYADGGCDLVNNSAECGYDSGDCCPCTCESTWLNTCGFLGFACIDPAAACVDDDDITAEMIENCSVEGIGDSWCDNENNNALCGYDGGDCCSCTCKDQPTGSADPYFLFEDGKLVEYKSEPLLLYEGCSGGSFPCIDPEAPCVDDDDITVDMVEACEEPGRIGNGYCDMENNIKACNYDGGDCCECTCNPTDGGCGRWPGFACIDPMAPCVDDDVVTTEMVDICSAIDIGDGYCDVENNIPECAYDGGDCCSCTCDSSRDGTDVCTRFACVDASAPCVDDDDITVEILEICDGAVGLGDGRCAMETNIPECHYDGGDCCECTCEGDEDDCKTFACIDPEAPCVDEDLVTVDMVENCRVLEIGDGICDSDNNNELCAYDGGDCCSCTQVTNLSAWQQVSVCDLSDGSLDASDFADCGCKDPNAPCFGEENPVHDDGCSGVPWGQQGPLPTVDGAVEVGTNTDVRVSATGSTVFGCGPCKLGECAPANTRDGIASESWSMWTCASIAVDAEGPCQIKYTFGEPQDIVDIQVAFWEGNKLTRTLEVYVNDERTHTHESYAGSTFNMLGVEASGVSSVMFESVGLLPDECISLVEVLIFVAPAEAVLLTG